jgi:hypothetical protein
MRCLHRSYRLHSKDTYGLLEKNNYIKDANVCLQKGLKECEDEIKMLRLRERLLVL